MSEMNRPDYNTGAQNPSGAAGTNMQNQNVQYTAGQTAQGSPTYQNSAWNANSSNVYHSQPQYNGYYNPNIPNYQQPVQQTPKKTKTRSSAGHTFLTVLLAGVVGLGAGFGGSWLERRVFSNQDSTAAVINHVTEDTENSAPQTVVSSGGGMTIGQIAAKASSSVVEITCTSQVQGYSFFGGPTTYESQSAGSGVIIAENGYIITNNHVVEGAETINVTLYDGSEYEAKLIGTDSKSDIGVIKIEATGLNAATIGDSSQIMVGDTAVVIGNPLGTLGGSVTNGIISAAERQVTINNETMNLIQTNAAINSGNSGGGLFDGNGNLIGIVNAKDSGFTSSGATIEGIGFAIPINDAMDVAEQLITSGKVTDRAVLGVTVQTVTQDNGTMKAGLYIAEIASGGGADKAGLHAGDQIIRADGAEVNSYTELSAVLKQHKPGETINVTVLRDGQELSFDVTLTGPLTTTTNKG